VIAGHIHQMLHFDLDSVMYLSIASSGGHLREDKAYDHGWFFQHTVAHVRANKVSFESRNCRSRTAMGALPFPPIGAQPV